MSLGSAKGRFLPFSIPRRMIADFLFAGQYLTLTPIQRQMRLGEVMAARAAAYPRPSWCALFVKSLSAVAARRPALRRVFVPYPWPRLFEYDNNIVSVVVHRIWEGEPTLHAARVRSPERMGLAELHQALDWHKNQPLESINNYRAAVRLTRIPLPIRRLLLGMIMGWMPRLRACLFGTLGVSVTAAMGAAALAVISPWTVALHYGVLEENGVMDVRLTFDHRVIDGALVAEVLNELEQELKGPIREELLRLAPANGARPVESAA